MADNPFDQYDAPVSGKSSGANVFDQYDKPIAPRAQTSSGNQPNPFDQYDAPTTKPPKPSADFSDVQSQTTFTPQTPAPGLGELATRGFVQGGASLLRTLQGVGDALNPGTSISNQLAESQMPESARAAFHEQTHPLDALAKDADEYAAPAPNEATPSLTGRVVQGAANLLPQVAAVIGMGGESAIPEAATAAARAVPYVGRVLGGIVEGLPTAAKFTGIQASNLPDTMTPGEKAKQAAKDFAINAAMAGLPAALGTSPLVRVPTGAAIGYGQSAAISALEGQPQDQAQNIIGAIQGGAFGLVPHRGLSGDGRDANDGQNRDQHEASDGGFVRNLALEPDQSKAYTPNLVADQDGFLREAQKQPEQEASQTAVQPNTFDRFDSPEGSTPTPSTLDPVDREVQKQRAAPTGPLGKVVANLPTSDELHPEPQGYSNPFDVFGESEPDKPLRTPDAITAEAQRRIDNLEGRSTYTDESRANLAWLKANADNPQALADRFDYTLDSSTLPKQPYVSDETATNVTPTVDQPPAWVRIDPRRNPDFFRIPEGSSGDLLKSIAQQGGLNLAAFKAQYGSDPALMSDRALNNKVVGKPLFRKNGGMRPDDLRELLQQDGWLNADDPNAPPQYSQHDAYELVDRAIRGEDVVHPADAEREAAIRNIESAQRDYLRDMESAKERGFKSVEDMREADAIDEYGKDEIPFMRVPVGTEEKNNVDEEGLPAGAQQLVSHETPLSVSNMPGLSAVRGQGDNDLPAVEFVRNLSGGHGPEADAETLDRSDQQRGQLRAGELPLGNSNGAGVESSLLHQDRRSDLGSVRASGELARHDASEANQEWNAAEASGGTRAPEDTKGFGVADAPRRAQDASAMGEAAGDTQANAGRAATTGNTTAGSIGAVENGSQAVAQAAFRKFFNGSRVTREDGSPVVVHHGTGDDFTVFDDSKLGRNTGHMTSPLGHFLTENRTEAQRYAEKAANGVPAEERVIEAYASIKNPKAMTLAEFLDIDSHDEARALRKQLEREGYDGIKLQANGKTQWVAFESGQIKDIDNRGTFDRNNPDIRYARSVDNSAPGLGKEEVDRLAAGVLKTNADRAGVHVVDSATSLPKAIQDHMQANGIPSEEVKAAHLGGKTYLVADRLKNAGDVQEAIYHDHFTHGGLRRRYDNRLGAKLDELLKGIGGMDGLRKMAADQGIDLSHYEATTLGNPRIPEPHQRLILMEELLAHMSKLTGTLKRMVQEWVGQLRDWLRRNGFSELAKYNETDLAHVLKQARQAATATVGSASKLQPFYMRTPADRAQGGTAHAQDRMRFERPTEDELHEAHSLAKNAVLRQAFDIAQDGKENVVRYKGKEVARIAGPVNRSNLTKAIAEQIKPTEAKAQAQTQTTAPLSDLPARRPGEERGAWLRRLSKGAAGEEVRRATALRAQQKIIGRHAIREMLAGRARAMDAADAIFGEYRKLFDKTHPAQNFAYVDAFETGRPIPDADFRAFLTQMKPGFVQRINRLRELNPNALQHLVTHYMPHLYDDPQRAAQVLSSFAQRRSIAGDKGFLKEREWPTLMQAMDAGLRPITNNPVDWVLLRYAGMDKLIGALELRKELQDRGWLHKVTEGELIPSGYARISDPTFNGYAVPVNFARDLTNYLDPGFSKYAAWRTLRGAQNFMVAADLGFSGFHAVFTSTDNVVMHLDVAARRAAIGDSRGAAATLVKAMTSVATSPFEGHKLNQQWRGIREADANTTAILDALERGGARWKMSSTEFQNAIPKVARWLRQMQGAGIAAQLKDKSVGQIALGTLKIPMTTLQAVAEMGSYLIHHVLVPNQKMAARVLLYKYELDRRAQTLSHDRGDYAGILDAMHPDVVRQIAADVNDVVDFRLGQMVYDSRFWNRTVQDVAQATVMAPGWQFGMVQTVAGAGKALKDIVSPGRFVAPLDKAGKITDAHMGRVGSNLSYFLTLALTLGTGNVMLQYLLSGKPYEQLKDAFFPKTGRKNDDDSDERLQLPNYWMDHWKLVTEPVQTAENKIHPLWKMLWELGHNRDYAFTQIRDPNAPVLDQAKQVGQYMASKFVPITVGSINKGLTQGESVGQQVGHFFGINNAPAKVRRSEFQNFVTQGGDQGWEGRVKTQAEADRRQTMRAAEAAIRKGQTPDFGNLVEKDRYKAQIDAQHLQPELYFKYLGAPDKIKAYEIATPEERQRYNLRQYMFGLKLDSSAPFKRMTPTEQDGLRKRLQAIRASH